MWSVTFQKMMFTIIYCLTFKQVKNHKLIVISFWLITEDLQIEKGLDSGLSHPNYVKCRLKIFCMTICIIWSSFMIKWFAIHIEKCTLHCWQTLIMMSQLQRKEQFKKKVMNRAFPWNKKIIRLWLHLFVFSGGNLENCSVDNILFYFFFFENAI